MTTNIGFIIQARTGSTRLPNKVLKPFFENKSILKLIVEKIKINFPNYPLVIATSNEIGDHKIKEFAINNEVICYQGSEKNVLSRFIETSKHYNFKTIIRVCADNPFLDVDLLKQLINTYKESTKEFDYISYKDKDGLPVIKKHYGFFAELVTLDALKKVQKETGESVYLEHVTNYIYERGTFKIKLIEIPDFIKGKQYLRLTIDDELDFNNLKEIYETYKQLNYDLKKILIDIERKPQIISDMRFNINKYSK